MIEYQLPMYVVVQQGYHVQHVIFLSYSRIEAEIAAIMEARADDDSYHSYDVYPIRIENGGPKSIGTARNFPMFSIRHRDTDMGGTTMTTLPCGCRIRHVEPLSGCIRSVVDNECLTAAAFRIAAKDAGAGGGAFLRKYFEHTGTGTSS